MKIYFHAEVKKWKDLLFVYASDTTEKNFWDMARIIFGQTLSLIFKKSCHSMLKYYVA